MADRTPDVLEAVIIGAGQAGLAAAHGLARGGLNSGADFLVLDANDGPGGAWRHRWDSLTLGRAHGIADLPGMRLGEVDPTVPASRIVADYYGRYEEKFGLDVRRPVRVRAVRDDVERSGAPQPGQTRSAGTGARGTDRPRRTVLRIETDHEGDLATLRARFVINATGTWTAPFVPHLSGIEAFTGRAVHTRSYVRAEAFAGQRVIVIGGGLSAVQFLLELEGVAETTWATRRPPQFTDRVFDEAWGRDVETAVSDRVTSGLPPRSVVAATGIPPWPDYLAAVDRGTLVSRGMITEVRPRSVVFDPAAARGPENPAVGRNDPQEAGELAVPASWDPYRERTEVPADVLFFNTGFRAAIAHLAPLGLRGRRGGVTMRDGVRVAADDRVLMVGYGPSASTLGATRAGRRAARAVLAGLRDLDPA